MLQTNWIHFYSANMPCSLSNSDLCIFSIWKKNIPFSFYLVIFQFIQVSLPPRSLLHSSKTVLDTLPAFILVYRSCYIYSSCIYLNIWLTASLQSPYAPGGSLIIAVPNIKFCDRFQNTQSATDILSFDHHIFVNGRINVIITTSVFKWEAWDSGRWNN